MKKSPQFWWWFLPAAAVYAAGFAASTFLDLAINRALYTPGSLFAALMEAFGWYPAFLPVVALAGLWATQPGPGVPLWRRVLCGFVALASLAALYASSYGYLLGRRLITGEGDVIALVWLALGLLVAGLLMRTGLRLTPPTREKLTFFARAASLFMVANLAMTQALKYIWGRVRFDDMLAAGDFSVFTPWFRPFGPGGSSFPSGHTANATAILLVLVLCDLFPGLGRRRKPITVLCWVYIGLMALSRILIGRHFLSDTLAASALTALLFYFLHQSGFYQKHLRQTLKAAAELPKTREKRRRARNRKEEPNEL